MHVPKPRILVAFALGMLVCGGGVTYSSAQTSNDAPIALITPPSSLGLTPEKVSHLKAAFAGQDYVTAERILLAEIERDPHSARSAALLAYVGSVYYLNRDFLHAAIAWKKSNVITPLDPGLQFSLAMAYLQIAHADWARPVLESLLAQDRKNSLYTYWLGRLDYDAHRYPEAIVHFQEAISLAPTFSRAYDNLGLCYFYQNQNELAVSNFDKAIELDRNSAHPSAWPYLSRAETLQFMGKPEKAESSVREAIRLEAQLAAAHYRLGKILEDEGRLEEAASALEEAIRINARYAEAHIALAQIYNRLKRKEAADKEVEIYRGLRADANGAKVQ
ncbi:tetratricopeptide repeat protein [Granulicella arctica]|uniref:tetratricopeptide repeat protein n=1 Tax=Granulicella arctica TaxID=940613 RepID=UPI0021DFC79B|nr:tetratricopeptide repeat protein [Granulicella arctica]